MHRSGFWPQRRSFRDLLADANHELLELGSAYGDEAGSNELADLQVMVCAIALRYGLSFADLDALAVQKLYLRFPGSADAEAAADAMTKDRIPLVLCIRSDSETGEAL